MYTTTTQRSAPRPGAGRCAGIAAAVWLAASALTAQAQKIYYESFENLPLGPNIEEALVGQEVFSDAPPLGWVLDDTGVPGIGTALDGVVEWAGWSFAKKDWWVSTAGNQERVKFIYGQGTVMIADPDEWDDAGHAPGLLNAYATAPVINIQGAAENSLILTMDSSWRPEAFDDGLPNFPVDPNNNNRPINNQTGIITAKFGSGAESEVLHFSSDNTSPDFHKDGDFINEAVVIPLNNPAGNSTLSLKFGMLLSANDWWWAVDNIAVGVPPFVSSVTNNGVSFGARITEALEKVVDDSKPITVQLDDQLNVAFTQERDDTRLWLLHSIAPAIFAPRSHHTVKVSFTTLENKSVVDSVEFVAPSYVSVAATPTQLRAVITDTDWLTVDESKGVQVELDGKAIVPQSIERVDLNVIILYTPAELFDSGSAHVLKVKYTASTGQVLEESVPFKSSVYTTLPAELATDVAGASVPGMRWRTHEVDTTPGRANSIAETERQLGGQIAESIHDASGQGPDGFFEIDFVNFEQTSTAAGNFKSGGAGELDVPDTNIPGIPGTSPTGASSNDYIAAESLGYLHFATAGLYQMAVNSDDGFQVSAGVASDPRRVILSGWDGGRGATDTIFYFRVTKPGVYLFRLLYFEGTGGASVEWFTVNPDGTRALVGGAQPGAIPSFRTRSSEPVSNGIQSIARTTDNKVAITYAGSLKSSASVTGPYTAVAGATAPQATITPAGAQQFYRAE